MNVANVVIAGVLAVTSPFALAASPNLVTSVAMDPQTFAMLLSGLLFAGILLRRGP